jgi:hypothetical protein
MREDRPTPKHQSAVTSLHKPAEANLCVGSDFLRYNEREIDFRFGFPDENSSEKLLLYRFLVFLLSAGSTRDTAMNTTTK